MTLKRNKEFFDEFLGDFSEDETVDVVEFDMGYVPFTIERISDGSILRLNRDNKTYSFTGENRVALPDGHGYTWGRLFRDHRCVGAFKPLGWVKLENLESAHKAYENDN